MKKNCKKKSHKKSKYSVKVFNEKTELIEERPIKPARKATTDFTDLDAEKLHTDVSEEAKATAGKRNAKKRKS